jgi:SWI/SNF-related matrix-associated actin-dependent regulator of chromatin subfamily A member 5
LFQGVEPDDAPELGDHLIKVSGKLLFLDKLLKKCKEDNSQTLIFSGFTTMLDILEDYCRYRDYKYCRLDGNTELDDRQS